MRHVPLSFVLLTLSVLGAGTGCSGMFQSGPMKLEVAGGRAAVSGPAGIELGGGVGSAPEETCARDGVVVPCETAPPQAQPQAQR